MPPSSGNAAHGGPPSRLIGLIREYNTLKFRYGVAESPPQLARIDQAVQRRQYRLDFLRRQAAEIAEELHWIETEVEKFDKGRELVLVDAIEDLRRRFPEAWSPTPPLGFRWWDVSDGRFCGFRQIWPEPSLRARCLTTNRTEEIPHTDGSCGSPPCGIYAAKSVSRLVRGIHIGSDVRSVAVGLVALEGKVVEHEHGYRAAVATTRALAVSQPGSPLPAVTADPDTIGEVFADARKLQWWFRSGGDSLVADAGSKAVTMIKYLEEQERMNQWT
jgi:hypothetical protein